MEFDSGQSLDLIIPCYNPPEGWADVLIDGLLELRQSLPETKFRFILVDDGSTPSLPSETIGLIKASIPGFSFIAYPENRGKGHAVRQGFQQATGDWVAFTDVDIPYKTTSFVSMYRTLMEEKADIVVGHRSVDYYEKVPWLRKHLSKLLRQLIKWFLKLPVEDTQGGLKFFSPRGCRICLQTTIDGYLFDMELIKSAAAQNLSIRTVPIELRANFQSQQIPLRTLLGEINNWFKILIK